MMSEEGSLPKLRFPEFHDAGDWKKAQLGPNTIKVGSGITPTGGSKAYKTSGRTFVRSKNVGWGQLLLNDVAFIDEETHASFSGTEIKESDVFLNISGASIGRSALADARVCGGNVNQHVCIIRVKLSELSPVFLNQYLNSSEGQNQIDSFQAGGNRQGLNFSQIRSFLIPTPAPPEQQKIADCLTSVDDLITAEAQKLEALKAHKKGLMQQLFPREGETTPRLRFPEFRDAGDWDERPLGKVAAFHSGGTPSKSNPRYWDGDIPWISALSMHETTIGKSKEKVTKLAIQDGAKLATSGTLLLLVRGSMLHKRIPIGITTTEVTYNQDVKALSLDDGVKTEFLLNLLIAAEWDLLGIVTETGIGAGKLDSNELNAFVIKIPSPAEQQKIVDCLAPLNELVTAQTLKVEALKDHKKGLMQQLFPASDEVSG